MVKRLQLATTTDRDSQVALVNTSPMTSEANRKLKPFVSVSNCRPSDRTRHLKLQPPREPKPGITKPSSKVLKPFVKFYGNSRNKSAADGYVIISSSSIRLLAKLTQRINEK